MLPEEIANTPLKEAICIALDRLLSDAQLPTSKTRSVLDVGCGRGETVGILRRNGWEAYGAEIDVRQSQIARMGLNGLGLDSSIIFDISSSGKIMAGEKNFDYILSDNVVEHVEDIEAFVDETWRLLKPGGAAFHLFPARWSTVERHVRQPCVHWLPKGRLRRMCVRVWVWLGVEAGWLSIVSLSANERARRYADYLDAHTHYRTVRQLRQAFLRRFESFDLSITSDILAGKRRIARLMSIALLRKLSTWLCVRFHTAAIIVTKAR